MLNKCRADPKHIGDSVLRCVNAPLHVSLGRRTRRFKVEGLKLSLCILLYHAQVRENVFDLGGKLAEENN